jgi:hypothetical protein
MLRLGASVNALNAARRMTFLARRTRWAGGLARPLLDVPDGGGAIERSHRLLTQGESDCDKRGGEEVLAFLLGGNLLAHGTKFPLSARIVAAQRYLARILDSFWTSVASLF